LPARDGIIGTDEPEKLRAAIEEAMKWSK